VLHGPSQSPGNQSQKRAAQPGLSAPAGAETMVPGGKPGFRGDPGPRSDPGSGYALRSSAAKRSTIAAAGSTSAMAPTLWPAYIAIASMSPSVPTSGALNA
jgi:hypothetical protein